jgi:hypothetical protein
MSACARKAVSFANQGAGLAASMGALGVADAAAVVDDDASDVDDDEDGPIDVVQLEAAFREDGERSMEGVGRGRGCGAAGIF